VDAAKPHTSNTAGMIRALVSHENGDILHHMSSICWASIDTMDVVDAAACGVLFDDSFTHLNSLVRMV